jgi:hypothetical protein
MSMPMLTAFLFQTLANFGDCLDEKKGVGLMSQLPNITAQSCAVNSAEGGI